MVSQPNEQQPSVFNTHNHFTKDTNAHSNQQPTVCTTDNQSTNDATTRLNGPPTVDNLSMNDASTYSNVTTVHLSQVDCVCSDNLQRLEQCIDSAPGNMSCQLNMCNSQQSPSSNNSEHQIVQCSQYHTSTYTVRPRYTRKCI